MKKRTGIIMSFALATVAFSSCTKEDRFSPIVYNDQEIYTVFNITIADNTKSRTKTKTITKSDADSKTSYDAVKLNASIAADVAFGIVGIDCDSKAVKVDNQPVYEEENGVRTTNIVTEAGPDTVMNLSAYYPFVNDVSYHKDGSYAISYTPDDIVRGPLASNAVLMRCDQSFETVSLRFHHISNSVGFKVCDITEDEQLKGLMHVRKVVLHGMPDEGMYVVDGDSSHWVPNAKHKDILIFEGNEKVYLGEENALFIAKDKLTDIHDDCHRSFVIPEKLKEGKHYVEVIFDVDPFDYDGTHYKGARNQVQKIPLSGVISNDLFELGLQYTFVLGMNLGTVYRPIEFTASIDEWELRNKCRIIDYDNE